MKETMGVMGNAVEKEEIGSQPKALTAIAIPEAASLIGLGLRSNSRGALLLDVMDALVCSLMPPARTMRADAYFFGFGHFFPSARERGHAVI
jgi:hypothetical protein